MFQRRTSMSILQEDVAQLQRNIQDLSLPSIEVDLSEIRVESQLGNLTYPIDSSLQDQAIPDITSDLYQQTNREGVIYRYKDLIARLSKENETLIANCSTLPDEQKEQHKQRVIRKINLLENIRHNFFYINEKQKEVQQEINELQRLYQKNKSDINNLTSNLRNMKEELSINRTNYGRYGRYGRYDREYPYGRYDPYGRYEDPRDEIRDRRRFQRPRDSDDGVDPRREMRRANDLLDQRREERRMAQREMLRPEKRLDVRRDMPRDIPQKIRRNMPRDMPRNIREDKKSGSQFIRTRTSKKE